MVLNYGLYDSNTSKFLLPIITVIRNCFEHLEYLTLLGLGWGASRLVASIILMQLFVDLSNWFKVSWLFLILTLKNFVKIFFLVISVSYCWLHHFLTKVVLVKLKILYILMQWSKWFIFWNFFLYCKNNY